MSNLLNPDNKIMNGINRAIDAAIIGTLWFICCIPVITVGASSTAFYYAYNKAIRQKRGYAWKEFFSAFKSNFKQSTIIWLIMMVLYLITGLDCIILTALEEPSTYTKVLFMIIVAIMIAITVWTLYVFPYLARFANTTKVMLKNSALIALANLPWSILLLILFGISAFIFLLLPMATFIVPAVYMWIANKIMERIFRKYMTEEEVKRQEELEKMD